MHLHALETIERNAQAQAQLIEDLLDVSRIISGKLRFESRLLQLQTVVHAAIEAVRPAAEAKDIIIEADYDPSVDSIFGDSTRVQQIIWNLLTNAVKFTPPGGRVQVKLERRDAVAVVSVKDSGAGISPKFLPYVFERFRQADGTTTRRQGGLGLGLAIVSHLVEMHGGTVEAQSEGLDRGSTFVVTFPLAAFIPAVSLEMQDTIAYNAQGRHDDLQGLHIHVVDDEPDAVELLRVMLAQYGASVTTSNSAQQAIGSIRQSWPDLLISDIGMPYQDGYELIRELRDMDEERGKLLPAIALTAYAAIEDQQRAVLAGFQTHVTKPVEPQVLINAITQLTGRAQVNDEYYNPEGWKDV
jgi:CheY-like chemotaxis protein